MRPFRRTAALLLALLLALPATAAAYYSAHVYRSSSADERRVAITVDDMFNMKILSQMLDLFDQYQVKVTLFPVGSRIKESDRDLWRRAVDAGHEIGNHTNNHRKLAKLTGYQIRTEVNTMQKRLNAALGYEYPLTILRPPYGSLGENGGSSHAGRELYKLGYHTLILWSVSNTDPEEALKLVKNGSILLYHTNGKDYRCLQTLIPALLDKSYELVTVSELLHLDANGDAPTPTPAPGETPAAVPSATPGPSAGAAAVASATPGPDATVSLSAGHTPAPSGSVSGAPTPSATPASTAKPEITPTPPSTVPDAAP